MDGPYWPFAVYAGLVVILAVAMIGLAWLLGERHRDPDTGVPYEGGVSSTGGADVRLSVGFHLYAVLFVIFDLEAVFLFGWAVAAPALGWAGYVEAIVFIAVLGVALLYLWRSGALRFLGRRP